MAFAQITYRESLRDIEVCLSAQSAELYHMGVRGPMAGPEATESDFDRVEALSTELRRFVEAGGRA
jgi:Domain of unknown function (DUF4372)